MGKELYTIDLALVDAVTMRKIASGVKPATVNRTLALIRSVLRAACDWEWTEGAPKFDCWLSRKSALGIC
jgi:hypothetical protein